MNSTSNTPYLFVMAGGSGTRFWPKSTSAQPKQLLSFGKSKETLLEMTLNRFNDWIPDAHRFILTNKKIEAHVKSIIPKDVGVLAEPIPRNTAPCLYWGAKVLSKIDPHAVMIVMSSDHYIANNKNFINTVKKAADHAQDNSALITLGITPTRPETGYGYLELGDKNAESYRVKRFVEKPELKKAIQYFESKNFLWNAGMFVWRVDALLKAFNDLMPEMDEIWDKHKENAGSAFPELTATSIDYGILEKSENVITYPLDCGWDDLGSWIALETLSKEMQTTHVGGVLSSATEWLSIESKNNIVDVPGKTLVTIGMEDTIIVNHNDVLLVAKKEHAQDIKKAVEQLKSTRPELV